MLPAERIRAAPVSNEPMGPLDHQVAFLLEADRLKTVLRQSTLTDRSRRENSAEHSWHLTLMALVLAEYAPPGLDLQRVLAMLVLHDVVEIDAGEDRLFGLLPPDQAERFRRTWDEFEERVSPEAKFARAMDRLQPMLINMVTGGGTWVAHGVTADQVLTRVALIADGSPALAGSPAT
jgi:putative hydrolase of HD superfamily